MEEDLQSSGTNAISLSREHTVARRCDTSARFMAAKLPLSSAARQLAALAMPISLPATPPSRHKDCVGMKGDAYMVVDLGRWRVIDAQSN